MDSETSIDEHTFELKVVYQRLFLRLGDFQPFGCWAAGRRDSFRSACHLIRFAFPSR